MNRYLGNWTRSTKEVMTLSVRVIEKIFLRTAMGRIGYVLRIYNPWSSCQTVSLRDFETDEYFDAVTNDLSRISGDEALKLKSDIDAREEGRLCIAAVIATEIVQETVAKRADFIRNSGRKDLGTRLMESLPRHGYLICNYCDAEVSMALKVQCIGCAWPICACGACRCGAKVRLHPAAVEGGWKFGITLDLQTLESTCTEGDGSGHPAFETRRSELGELLYQFKYRAQRSALRKIVDISVESLSVAKGGFGVVLPIPPSNPARTVTRQIAEGIAVGLGVETSETALIKVRATDALKGISDHTRRMELLCGAFSADAGQMRGKIVLLVDDLYRSGATLEAATEVAYAQGGALAVFVFAVTRTRVHR